MSPQRKPKPPSKRASPTAAAGRSKPGDERSESPGRKPAAPKRKASSLLDTRVIFCGDNLQKLADFPDALTTPPECHGLLAIRAFFRRSGKSIIALTVQEILDEEIAKKLA